jgi:hypothetical protein
LSKKPKFYCKFIDNTMGGTFYKELKIRQMIQCL